MSYTNGLDNPELYFQSKIYTGNGSTQSITLDGSENMQPDWVWIKDRDGTERHCLTDSVRGVLKELRSNTTDAESDRSSYGGVSAFNSNGFSLVHDDGYNDNNSLQVSWNWKAGGSASSNSDGSITSSVSANTTAGFSIVSWTADGGNASTAGHGLGSTPKIVIYKDRGGGAWYVLYTFVDGSQDYLLLNGTNAKADLDSSTYGTATSTTISNIGFTSGNNMIAYCFAEKTGYSKFGSYVGNGSSDGSYIHLGFKPSFLMYKQISASGESWIMHDNARNLFNVTNKRLLANASNAEADEPIDFLSGGFKCRTSGAFQNASGSTYIYMAFAESPFVTSTGIPTNAR